MHFCASGQPSNQDSADLWVVGDHGAGRRHGWFLEGDHQTGMAAAGHGGKRDKAGGRLPALLVAKRRGACRRARTRRALHPGLSWAGGLAMHDAHQAFRAGAQSAPWTWRPGPGPPWTLLRLARAGEAAGWQAAACSENARAVARGGRRSPNAACRNLRYFLPPSTDRFEV